MGKKLKAYEVEIDMKYSYDSIIVKAKNKSEAKKKAWKKLQTKIKRKDFILSPWRNDYYDNI